MTRLTPEILKTHGFIELEEKDNTGRPIYSLNNIKSKYDLYAFNIQVVLNPQYPDSNPNSGIVSLFMPELTYSVIPEDLLHKDEFTEEDEKRVDENIQIEPACVQPIAWHVTTYERLKKIVESLTLTNLEYGQ